MSTQPAHSSQTFVTSSLSLVPSSCVNGCSLVGNQQSPAQEKSSIPHESSYATNSSPQSTEKQAGSNVDSTLSTPRYTPSPTPFMFGTECTTSPFFTFSKDLDRDKPLPSTERDVSNAGSKCTTPKIPVLSRPMATDGPEKGDECTDTLDESMRSLRLATPTKRLSTSHRAERPLYVHSRATRKLVGRRFSLTSVPTPSVQVTPAPADNQPAQHKDESIVQGLDALCIRSSSNSESPDRSRARENGSTTPSRRRRSGSAVNKDPHCIENEELPLFFSRKREIHEALIKARAMSKTFADVLSSSDLHREQDSSIGKFHREALRLSEFEPPSSRIVGLVGDSGVGKSSLINSLLDMKDLARSNNNGSACTCVATEYHYHNRSDFVVQAEYFTLEELKQQYEDLVRAYQENKSPPPGTTQDDLKELQLRAQLAEDTFKASFGDRLDQTPGVLALPVDCAVKIMLQWASALLPRNHDDQSTGPQESYDDVVTCSSRIRELTSEFERNDGNGMNRSSPWPFVRKLKVYLKAYILSEGLIIADLPGLQDTNIARQNISERYILHCHQILAVTRIARAMTDQSVKDVLQLARRAKLFNVHIVCTYSDEIRAKEAADTYPAKKGDIQALQERIKMAKQEIDTLTDDIDDFDQDILDRSLEEDREYLDLHRSRLNSERNKANAEFELLQLTVTVRNADVVRGLRSAYKDHPIAEKFQTFCVSNKIYWANRKKPATVSQRYLELSGIMQLRKYCIGVVADSYTRAARHYIKHEIPTLLESTNLWVEVGSGNAGAEKKQKVLNAANAVEAKLRELTSPLAFYNYISDNLNNYFDLEIQRIMEIYTGEWVACSKGAASTWCGWHHSSFAAFCRNYGDYQTKIAGSHCWNEEAMSLMLEKMSPIWDDFAAYTKHPGLVIKEGVRIRMKDAYRLVWSSVNASAEHSALSALTKTLRHRASLLLYNIQNAIDEFHDAVFALRTSAFTPLRTAFIGLLLEESYRAANMEHGSGSDSRRKDIIFRKFSSEALFVSHKYMLREGFYRLSSTFETSIQDAIVQQVSHIETDLRLLRDENIILESERNPRFREMLAQEIDRIGEELRTIRGELGWLIQEGEGI